MKLILDNDQQIEPEKAQNIGEGDIIIKLRACMRQEDINSIEEQLAKKFNRRVVVLDARFGGIYALPPKKYPGRICPGTVGWGLI